MDWRRLAGSGSDRGYGGLIPNKTQTSWIRYGGDSLRNKKKQREMIMEKAREIPTERSFDPSVLVMVKGPMMRTEWLSRLRAMPLFGRALESPPADTPYSSPA